MMASSSVAINFNIQSSNIGRRQDSAFCRRNYNRPGIDFPGLLVMQFNFGAFDIKASVKRRAFLGRYLPAAICETIRRRPGIATGSAAE
jgi:hypothetical protein